MRRWKPLFAMTIVALILAVITWQRFLPASRASGAISIYVPGAANLAVYCGGEETHFADGEWIELLPEGPECELEGPLSSIMPVRGHLRLDGSARYQCTRRAMEYVCVSR